MIGARSYLWLKTKRKLDGILGEQVAEARSVRDFPKKIFMFWDKGRSAAPPVCELCIRSWEELNPGWTVKVYDQETAQEILPRDTFPENMRISHYTDMLRVALLQHFGGLWADATLLCVKPVDQWLLPLLLQSDFFVFSRPGTDRMMASWFIASRSDSAMLEVLLKQYQRYWDQVGGAQKPYFWFHYIFEYLAKFDPQFRQEWQKVPKLGADPLHRLQRRFAGVVSEENALEIVPYTPVQKLNFRSPATVDDYLDVLAKFDWPYLEEVSSRPFPS